jgi:hypothetical protein
MNQEALNLSIRKFLKTVGVSSQREIELAVMKAVDQTPKGDKLFPATMTLEVPGLGLNVVFRGEISVE